MPQSDVAWASDLELVEQILRGSREHFEQLYEAYFPRVFRFALKRLGDPGEAEDVAQEVFFTVFRSLPSYQGNAPLLIWIFGVTRNTAVKVSCAASSASAALRTRWYAKW